MDINQVIALAQAGFTAAQIARMSELMTQTPAPAPTQAPAPAPAPTPEQTPAPAPAPAAGTDLLDRILNSVEGLKKAVQTQNINNSQQPDVHVQTADDVIASIINPTINKEV